MEDLPMYSKIGIIGTKEEKSNALDILQHRLSSQINKVYTNLIHEVNNCVTALLTTANSSADVLEMYLQKEIETLKLVFKLDPAKKSLTSELTSNSLTTPNKVGSEATSKGLEDKGLKLKMTKEGSGWVTKQGMPISPKEEILSDYADLMKKFDEDTPISQYNSQKIEPLDDPFSSYTNQMASLNDINFENNLKAENGLDDNSFSYDIGEQFDKKFDIKSTSKMTSTESSLEALIPEEMKIKLDEMQKQIDNPDLHYTEKRKIAKDRLKLKRENGLLTTQLRQKEREIKRQAKMERRILKEQQNVDDGSQKIPGHKGIKYVIGDIKELETCSARRRRELLKENMKFRRENGLLWRQKTAVAKEMKETIKWQNFEQQTKYLEEQTKLLEQQEKQLYDAPDATKEM